MILSIPKDIKNDLTFEQNKAIDKELQTLHPDNYLSLSKWINKNLNDNYEMYCSYCGLYKDPNEINSSADYGYYKGDGGIGIQSTDDPVCYECVHSCYNCGCEFIGADRYNQTFYNEDLNINHCVNCCDYSSQDMETIRSIDFQKIANIINTKIDNNKQLFIEGVINPNDDKIQFSKFGSPIFDNKLLLIDNDKIKEYNCNNVFIDSKEGYDRLSLDDLNTLELTEHFKNNYKNTLIIYCKNDINHLQYNDIVFNINDVI
jgi:hypothetical protein